MSDSYEVRYRKIEVLANLPAIREHVIIIHDVAKIGRSRYADVVLFNDRGDVIRSIPAQEFISIRKIRRMLPK